MRASIKLHNGDCMEALRGMADNAFDLAIVDPPYGIGIDGQKESINGKKSDRKGHAKKGWDSAAPPMEYFDELMRVSVNQIIWGANYFVEHLKDAHKGWIVWDKGQHGLTMSDCELAYSSFDVPTRVWVQNRCILIQEGSTIHPTQKSIKMYKWLLSNYAKEGDKILDTHLGSGSIAIACWDAGYDLTGYELDKDYYDAACARLEKHKSQGQFNI
jgi:site-specific DNA-methyltransferase (adenine-specific)